MTSPPESHDLIGRTVDFLRRAGEAAKDGVVRNYQRSTLKLEVGSLRRSLEDVTRDIGRQAIDVLRESGTLSTERVAPLLRRVDELEDLIAAKERQIADIERDEAATGGSESFDGAATMPRRRPSISSPGDDAAPGNGDGSPPPA
jgi:transposase